MTKPQNGALVLKNEDGDIYAIPTDMLERFKVTDEIAAKIDDQEDEVSGFNWFDFGGWNVNWWSWNSASVIPAGAGNFSQSGGGYW